MKSFKFIGFYFLIVLITSCNNDKENLQGEFEFITEYSATITVGGIVGITERTFEIREVYNGTDDGGETITIRIAERKSPIIN